MVTIKITISTPANDIVCSSAALISGARYSRMNSDWVSFEHQAGKNHSESDSNDIVSLCLHHYGCGVDSAIL